VLDRCAGDGRNRRRGIGLEAHSGASLPFATWLPERCRVCTQPLATFEV
jgi:hypothetical protein